MSDDPPAAAPGAGRWATLANGVSLFRLALAPVSLHAVLAGRWQLAAAVFAAAVASDFLDGFLARQRGTVSALGGVLDHTADAVFVAVTLWAVAFAEAQVRVDLVPGVLPLFIVLAFAQYLLDSKALAGESLRASWLGRANGIAYFVIAGVVIARHAWNLTWLPAEAVYWAGLLVLVSTLASMFDRARVLLGKHQSRGEPSGGVGEGPAPRMGERPRK